MNGIRRFLILTATLLTVTLGPRTAFAMLYEEYWDPEWGVDFYCVYNEDQFADVFKEKTGTKDLKIYIRANLSMKCGEKGHAAMKKWFKDSGAGSDGSLAIVAGLLPGKSGDDGERYTVEFDGGNEQQFLNLYDDDDTEADDDCFHARFIGITFTDCHGEYGGAVYANANASFYRCTFNHCTADEGGALCYPGDVSCLTSDRRSRVDFCGKRIAVEKCTFSNCSAEDYGGAIEGTNNDSGRWPDNIYDSTFKDCTAKEYGGAIYKAYEGIYRCTFENCQATDGGYGGALYGCGQYNDIQDTSNKDLVYGIRECLFKNCSAYRGGALANASGKGNPSYVYNCTFINCKATDTDADYKDNATFDRAGDSIYLYNSLFYGCHVGDAEVKDHNTEITDKNYFYEYDKGKDYYFNICNEDGTGGYGKDPWWAVGSYYFTTNSVVVETDIRGRIRRSGDKEDVIGCFSYYTVAEWKQYFYDQKPYEYDPEVGCDPLTVTVATDDAVEPKDGKITFREALKYFGDAAIRTKSSHKNSIVFNTSSRTVMLKHPCVDVAKTGVPLTIDGGDKGITLETDGSIEGWTIGFYGDSGDKRTFTNATLRIGIVVNSNSPKVPLEFVNCAFEDGGHLHKMGRVGSKWDSHSDDVNWKFERCTFKDVTTSAYLLDPGCMGTIITFDACTFTGISMPASIVRGVGKSINYRNCTFYNNTAPTMRPDWRDAPSYIIKTLPAENYFNCIVCKTQWNLPGNPTPTFHATETNDNPGAVFESITRVVEDRSGVQQVGFKPKHGGTARGGDTKDYSDWRKVPKYDIFGHERPTSRFLSQGSWYVDDKEDPSLLVDTAADVVDAYDGYISLREAVQYAGAHPYELYQQSMLTPIFDPKVFTDGKVVLKVNSPIPVNSPAFEAMPLRIQPGEDQSLVLAGDNGVFTQAPDTILIVNSTTFRGAKRDGGGAALCSYGVFQIADCAFESCTASEANGFGGAVQMFELDGYQSSYGTFYGCTFKDCKAAWGGAIYNENGWLRAVNVVFTGNSASRDGSALMHSNTSGEGSSIVANADIVLNGKDGSGAYAFGVSGTGGGLINSIVIGNRGGGDLYFGAGDDAWSAAPETYKKSVYGNWFAHTLTDANMTDVFTSGTASVSNFEHDVAMSYFSLKAGGLANGKGAYLFGKLDQYNICYELYYSTDPDGFDPYIRELSGKKGIRQDGGALYYDLFDDVISAKVPPGIGPLPYYPPIAINDPLTVTMAEDAVGVYDGQSLREAVAEALKYGKDDGKVISFSRELIESGKPIVLENQLRVPKDKYLHIAAPLQSQIVLRVPDVSDGYGRHGKNRFFYVDCGGELELEGLTMSNGWSTADYSAEIFQPKDYGDGGAVLSYGILSAKDCRFRCNRARNHGGAVAAFGPTALVGCRFEDNVAGLDGGAVYADPIQYEESSGVPVGGGSDFVIRKAWMSGNVAQQDGGAFYLGGCTDSCLLDNVKIVKNTAKRFGGGIYVNDKLFNNPPEGNRMLLTLQDVVVQENTAKSGENDLQYGNQVNLEYVSVINEALAPSDYYEVEVSARTGKPDVVLSEKAKPEIGEVELGGDEAAIAVGNVIPGLVYGLGRAESPAGPYEVDEWVKPVPGKPLVLTAEKESSSAFYRVEAKEAAAK